MSFGVDRIIEKCEFRGKSILGTFDKNSMSKVLLRLLPKLSQKLNNSLQILSKYTK